MAAQALPFTSADYNPVTLAKGGTALTETSTVASAAFANPASIVYYEDTFDVSLGYVSWQPKSLSTSVFNLAGAYKIGQKFGLALGFSHGMYPEYAEVDLSGYEKGVFKPSNMQIGLGLAYRILPFMSLGLNVGYASEKLASDVSYGSLDADVFAMLKFGSFRAAVGVSELGGKVKSKSGAEFTLPASANLGAGYTMLISEKHAIDVNADANYYFKDGIAASAGASYTFNDMISIRAGYRYGGKSAIPSFASVGAGFKVFGIKADFTYLFGSKTLTNSMALSLGYTF